MTGADFLRKVENPLENAFGSLPPLFQDLEENLNKSL